MTFTQLESSRWNEVFHDPCTRDWKENWFLDGKKAGIENSEKGMDFTAGPVFNDDSCHAVLWTKETFRGNLRIDYEYTKLDETIRAVTILYIQATGSGSGPYHKDIAEWSELRETPTMSRYYDHMNLLHITYAAFGLENTDPAEDYIRARRYVPETGRGMDGTALEPDNFRTGLFQRGVRHQITVIKTENQLFMNIRNNEMSRLCCWETDRLPPIVEGRIGLRHMYTRGARYRNFRVSTGEAVTG